MSTSDFFWAAKATGQCDSATNDVGTVATVVETLVGAGRCPHTALGSPKSRIKAKTYAIMESNCRRNLDSPIVDCDKESGEWMRLLIVDDRKRGAAVPVEWSAVSKDPERVEFLQDGGSQAEWSAEVSGVLWIFPYFEKAGHSFPTQDFIRVKRTSAGVFRRVPVDIRWRFGVDGTFDSHVDVQNARLGIAVVGAGSTIDLPAIVSTGQNKEEEIVVNTPPAEPHCRILYLTANPAGTSPLALEQEIRTTEMKIRAAEHRDTLQLIPKLAVQPDDLLQAMNEHNPDIVHFSGHGTSDGIILLDDRGNPRTVSTAALASLFKTLKGNVRLVVLNTCFSQTQAEAIVEHIDFALGMTCEVSDHAAITFASAFYRAIGFGRTIQEAFDQGKTALLLEDISEDHTPRILAREGMSADAVRLVGRS